MAATITVVEVTGDAGSKVYTTITNRVRLFTKDQATNQTTAQITFPVPIPAAGFSYSYWKHVAIEVAGVFTKVDNVRHYSDGGGINWNFGTDGELRRGNKDAGDIGCPTANYSQATGVEGTTGDTIEVHPYYATETVKTINIDDDVVGLPAQVDSTGLVAAGYCKMIVMQVKVDTAANGALSGTQVAETLTWKYDVID